LSPAKTTWRQLQSIDEATPNGCKQIGFDRVKDQHPSALWRSCAAPGFLPRIFLPHHDSFALFEFRESMDVIKNALSNVRSSDGATKRQKRQAKEGRVQTTRAEGRKRGKTQVLLNKGKKRGGSGPSSVTLPRVYKNRARRTPLHVGSRALPTRATARVSRHSCAHRIYFCVREFCEGGV
jgi:hypothetical protein